MTDARKGPVAQILEDSLSGENEALPSVRHKRDLIEYLEGSGIEAKVDLVQDLMLNPPRLSDVIDGEDIAQLTPLMRAFLSALLVTLGNKTMASKASGVSTDTHYSWCRRKGPRCKVYQKVVPTVEEAATDYLEAVVTARAVIGVKRYKFNKNGEPLKHPVTGKPYYEYDPSDILLKSLMQARRPETWKSGHELSIDVSTIMNLGEEQLTRLARGENPKKVLDG